MLNESPYADVRVGANGALSLPALKWRELLFTGALRAEGDAFVRDPARPMAPFAAGDLFPVGVRFRARLEGRRVVVTPVGTGDDAPV